MSDVRKSFDFTAYISRQPGGAPILHVHGTCEMPMAGYRLVLQPLVPQGTNPTILILQLIEQKPESGAEVVTNTPVAYTQSVDGLEYPILEVHITPINTKIRVHEVR
ncbi:MAG: hypothetical protein SFU83_07185 [Meiothermus sp.]|nr:hypothetical protein [Meiothermus sp.]